MADNEILQAIYNDMQLMKSDMQLMKSDMQLINTDMQLMKSDMQLMKSDMQLMKSDMQLINIDVQTIKEKVTSIEITIENEMQVNIIRVAEGHLDLSRNLGEIKRNLELLNGKMEMNDLFIRHHDAEIKKLKHSRR